MIWLSIDPSKAGTGVAVWNGTELSRSFVIKPRGNKGAYYFGDEVVKSREIAFTHMAMIPDRETVCYAERGAGGMLNAVRAQGWMCGYIAAQLELHQVTLEEVGVSEWRRVIKEDQGVSWPASRDRKKALAIDLVKQLYNLDVCDDEADAILLGRACIRMFNIKFG